jgi:two-component system, cell cycle response regulator CtrA
MRILVAETTWATVALSAQLAAQKIGVMRATDADDLLATAEVAHLNAIVLDSRIRDLPAASAVRRLRQASTRTGILVIGRAEAREEAARLLEIGADDVVTEVTSPAEIVARLKAIVRRRAGRATPRIEIAGMVLDIDTQTVEVGGQDMHLTRLEYQLLEYLVLSANTVLSREDILTQLYMFEDEPHSRIVEAYICRIRRKMTDLGADASLLETAWGRGYMLRDPAALRMAA